VVPRARKGRKDPQNLVACCRPCNTIKGTRVYANLEEAKEHVLAHREELRKAWESKTAAAACQVRKGVNDGNSVRRLVSVEHVQELVSARAPLLSSDRRGRWPALLLP